MAINIMPFYLVPHKDCLLRFFIRLQEIRNFKFSFNLPSFLRLQINPKNKIKPKSKIFSNIHAEDYTLMTKTEKLRNYQIVRRDELPATRQQPLFEVRKPS